MAQRLGIGTGIATALGALALVVTTTACPPQREDRVITASSSRDLPDGGSYHLTLHASNALAYDLDVGGAIQVLVEAHGSGGSETTLAVVPDDATLDDRVAVFPSADPHEASVVVTIGSPRDVCAPAGADCPIGLTIEAQGGAVSTSVRATASGSFSAGAALALIED